MSLFKNYAFRRGFCFAALRFALSRSLRKRAFEMTMGQFRYYYPLSCEPTIAGVIVYNAGSMGTCDFKELP